MAIVAILFIKLEIEIELFLSIGLFTNFKILTKDKELYIGTD